KKCGTYNRLESDPMFNQALLLIYRLFLHRGGRKINWMEQYLDDDAGDALSPDDIRNGVCQQSCPI
ncbi:hypothetical protein, partial [Thiolapillus sp.]|uniref:hypothetical protein n=1 Tax=Thiolapillus sp. TaxID=2017437 RepID=UPI003AF49432